MQVVVDFYLKHIFTHTLSGMIQIILFQGVCFWEGDYLVNNVIKRVDASKTYGVIYDFDTYDCVILFGTIMYLANIVQ